MCNLFERKRGLKVLGKNMIINLVHTATSNSTGAHAMFMGNTLQDGSRT